MELIFAVGLGMSILAVGYRTYATISRADEYQAKLEAANLNTRNLMTRVKHDVRDSNLLAVFGDTVVLNSSDGRINYRALPAGVERMDHNGRYLYRGISARFSRSGSGLNVRLHTETKVHGRRIRVDETGFVCPRNG